MRRWTAVISAAAFLCCGLIFIPGAAQKAAQPPALTQEQWREDLRYFAKELQKRHKNLYHATSREQFERAVADRKMMR